MARPQAEKRRDLKLASGDNLRNLLEPEAARALFLASCTLVIVVSEARTQMILMMMMQRFLFVGKHAVKQTRCPHLHGSRSRRLKSAASVGQRAQSCTTPATDQRYPQGQNRFGEPLLNFEIYSQSNAQ